MLFFFLGSIWLSILIFMVWLTAVMVTPALARKWVIYVLFTAVCAAFVVVGAVALSALINDPNQAILANLDAMLVIGNGVLGGLTTLVVWLIRPRHSHADTAGVG